MSEPTDTPTGGLRRREVISGGAATSAPTPPAACASTPCSRARTTAARRTSTFKVSVGGNEVHTGQLFMSEKVARAV